MKFAKPSTPKARPKIVQNPTSLASVEKSAVCFSIVVVMFRYSLFIFSSLAKNS